MPGKERSKGLHQTHHSQIYLLPKHLSFLNFLSVPKCQVRCFGCLVKYTGAHLFLNLLLILRLIFIGVKLRGMEGLMMSQKTSLILLTYKLLNGIIGSIKATALIFSCCYELKQDQLLMLLHAFCFCH